MRATIPTLVLLSFFVAGCATKQPEWITSGPIGECTTRIGEDCLSRLIQARFRTVPGSLSRDVSALHMNAIANASKLQSSDLVVEPNTIPLTAFIASSNAFVSAGKAIAPILSGRPTEAVQAALSIRDKDASEFALLTIISLSDKTMDDLVLGRALNKLSELSNQAYLRGLQGRVAGLLVKGDIERADALRDFLLKNDSGTLTSSFTTATHVAACYAMAGMAPDATAILQDALSSFPEQIRSDNARVFGLVLKASQGEYPFPQDFYEFTSDQARLDAYLMLSSLYRRNNKLELASRALRDAVLLTQKSGFKVPLDQALTQLATSSLGVL